MKKKILVTGGTGFVGKQVVRNLYERGFQLRFIIRKGNHKPLDGYEVLNRGLNGAPKLIRSFIWHGTQSQANIFNHQRIWIACSGHSIWQKVWQKRVSGASLV